VDPGGSNWVESSGTGLAHHVLVLAQESLLTKCSM
jgi:hypothetical protein